MESEYPRSCFLSNLEISRSSWRFLEDSGGFVENFWGSWKFLDASGCSWRFFWWFFYFLPLWVLESEYPQSCFLSNLINKRCSVAPRNLKTHHSPVTKGRLGKVSVLYEGNCLVVYLPILVQRSLLPLHETLPKLPS